MKIAVLAREEDKANYLAQILDKLNQRFNSTKQTNPFGYLDAFESRVSLHCAEIAREIGAEFRETTQEYQFNLSGVSRAA